MSGEASGAREREKRPTFQGHCIVRGSAVNGPGSRRRVHGVTGDVAQG
jgi:hypothetical protein